MKEIIENNLKTNVKNSNSGMLFFYDWVKPFSQLNGNDFKNLVLAMIEYQQNGGEIPEFKGKADIIASFVFPQIERRNFISEKNRENSKKRWTSDPKEDEMPSVCNGNATDDANLSHKDKDKDQDKDKDKTSSSSCSSLDKNFEEGNLSDDEDDDALDYENSDLKNGCSLNEGMSSKREQEERFRLFWLAYPKKRQRKSALAEFLRIDPDEALWQRMLSALEAQKKTKAWRQENGRFVPLADNWLADNRWEEETVIDPLAESDAQNEEMWEDYFRSLSQNMPKSIRKSQ